MDNTYTVPPTTFPPVWLADDRMALPPRFAVWHPSQQDFTIVDVIRDEYPAFILKHAETARTTPFHFADAPSEKSVRMITVKKTRARVNPEVHIAVWFTGGWLCRKNDINRLQAVIPILGFSNTECTTYKKSVGVHKTNSYLNWEFNQTAINYREFVKNALTNLASCYKPSKSVIPTFVANALLKQAIADHETCPISMDDFQAGSTAITPCFHLFSSEALLTWLKTNATCPVCKTECQCSEITMV
jgi:hypothetical protein